MKWFKMLWLNSEERALLRAGKKEPQIVYVPTPVAEPTQTTVARPYKNVFYANKNLTVVFLDGTMLSKSNVQADEFVAVRDALSEKEIEAILVDRTPIGPAKDVSYETKEERQLVSDNLGIFNGNPEFVVKGKEVFLAGVNLAMPASIIASFIELLEKEEAVMTNPEYNGITDDDKLDELNDQLEALKMFWLKLALNTLPQSREDLLVFVRKNDVRITRNGNLILYRRIVTKTGADKELVTFVTQNYYKIKKEGSDPRNFAIRKSLDGYELVDLLKFDPAGKDGPVPFCNLQQMYLELPTYDTNSFTSAHDRNVEIKLGGVYQIPDSGINLDNGICAAGGLHAACVNYNYSGFGDLPVVVLVNPSKAITVPMGETGKLRTTEMFVACVNDQPIGTHFDESALGAFDSEYHDLTLGQLEEVARTKSFETMAVQNTVPAVSLVDLNVIRDMLKKRVNTIQ